MAAEHETVATLAQIVMSKRGARLFKNPMGQGIVGTVVEEYNDSGGHIITQRGARRIRFGVQNPGGSDLIGWRPLKITEGMIGQTVAQFIAVECKTPAYNKASKDQKIFLSQVKKSGGLALIARREGDDGVIFDELVEG